MVERTVDAIRHRVTPFYAIFPIRGRCSASLRTSRGRSWVLRGRECQPSTSRRWRPLQPSPLGEPRRGWHRASGSADAGGRGEGGPCHHSHDDDEERSSVARRRNFCCILENQVAAIVLTRQHASRVARAAGSPAVDGDETNSFLALRRKARTAEAGLLALAEAFRLAVQGAKAPETLTPDEVRLLAQAVLQHVTPTISPRGTSR